MPLRKQTEVAYNNPLRLSSSFCIYYIAISFFNCIFALTQTSSATLSNLKNCTRGVISGRKNFELTKILVQWRLELRFIFRTHRKGEWVKSFSFFIDNKCLSNSQFYLIEKKKFSTTYLPLLFCIISVSYNRNSYNGILQFFPLLGRKSKRQCI